MTLLLEFRPKSKLKLSTSQFFIFTIICCAIIGTTFGAPAGEHPPPPFEHGYEPYGYGLRYGHEPNPYSAPRHIPRPPFYHSHPPPVQLLDEPVYPPSHYEDPYYNNYIPTTEATPVVESISTTTQLPPSVTTQAVSTNSNSGPLFIVVKERKSIRRKPSVTARQNNIIKYLVQYQQQQASTTIPTTTTEAPATTTTITPPISNNALLYPQPPYSHLFPSSSYPRHDLPLNPYLPYNVYLDYPTPPALPHPFQPLDQEIPNSIEYHPHPLPHQPALKVVKFPLVHPSRNSYFRQHPHPQHNSPSPNHPPAQHPAEDPLSEPRDYSFEYAVHSPKTNDFKRAQETRSGSNVNGLYSFLQPDGNIRTVTYSAHPVHGFNAIVRQDPASSSSGLHQIPYEDSSPRYRSHLPRHNHPHLHGPPPYYSRPPGPGYPYLHHSGHNNSNNSIASSSAEEEAIGITDSLAE